MEKAYEFSKKAHSGQTRYSNEPYFVHPCGNGEDSRRVRHGRDDYRRRPPPRRSRGRVSRAEVEKEFWKGTTFIVDGVTKLGTHKYPRTERHAESLRRLLVATASDIRVLIVKLADRKHNMQTLEHVPEHKRQRIALETLEIYARSPTASAWGR